MRNLVQKYSDIYEIIVIFVLGYYILPHPVYVYSFCNDKQQEAQLSLTNRAMLVCKVVEVWQDFLSEYVDKKFTYICYRRLIRHEWIHYGSKKCVIYNSYKIAVFTYHSPHFCFPWRRPCDYHAICCMDGKTIQCLPNARSMYPSVFNSFPVIRTASAKNRKVFTYCSPHFCFPWGRPWGNHAKCCMGGKTIRCLQIVSLHVPI